MHEISQEEFEKCAEAASSDNCLKTRPGEYAPEYAIVLNSHIMMSSQVDKDGDRHYYSHM